MKKKLNLDKETLVRLQADQMQAAAGGAAAFESNVDAGFTDDPKSCCRKTCNEKEEPSPSPEIGVN